jgi:hypothetical protein
VNPVNPVNDSSVLPSHTSTTYPSPDSTDCHKVHVVQEVHEMAWSRQRVGHLVGVVLATLHNDRAGPFPGA